MPEQRAAAAAELDPRRRPADHLGLDHLAAVDPGPVGGAEVAQDPAAVASCAARRGGARRCRRRTRAGSRASGRARAGRRSRAASRPCAGRRRRRPRRARRGARRGQVGRQAAQLVAAATLQRAVDAARERVGVQPARDVAAAQARHRALPRVLRRPHAVAERTPVNGCETKLCAQLHKAARRATLPGNRLAASAVEEERGRSWGGSTERTRSARLRGASRALSVWRRGAMRVRSSQPACSQRCLNLR